MYRPTDIALYSTMAIVASATLVQAQTRRAPTSAQEALARHVEAVGGERALRGMASRYVAMETRLKVSDTLPEIESKSEYFFQAPKILVRMQMGPTNLEMGYDGRMGWTRSEWSGVERIGEEQIAALRVMARVVPSYEGARDLTLLGARTFEGRSVVGVRFRSDTSPAFVTDYYEVGSGLKVGADIEQVPSSTPPIRHAV